MNPRRWLAAVFVILNVVGCVQVATGPKEPPYVLYSHTEDMNNRGPDM
jgi:hypothetical protein